MTITYITRDTDRATGVHVSTHEDALELTTATLATESATLPKLTGATWLFTSPANEPNSSDWPSGDYHGQIDVDAVGADITYLTSGETHFARVDSGLTSHLETTGTNGSWDTDSGTGLHLFTVTGFDFASGSAADRFEWRFVPYNNNTMKSQDITINLNTSSTYADGPWTGAATPSLVLPNRSRMILRGR